MSDKLHKIIQDTGVSETVACLEKAVLNREANCLTLYFGCQQYPNSALQEQLHDTLCAEFPRLAIQFVFRAAESNSEPRASAATAAAVFPQKSDVADTVLAGKLIRHVTIVPISELTESDAARTICGRVILVEAQEAWTAGQNGNGHKKASESYRAQMLVSDDADSIYCLVSFDSEARRERFLASAVQAIKDDKRLLIRGVCRVARCRPMRGAGPKQDHELQIFCNDVNAVEGGRRQDMAADKRVELHLHTRMSTMDSLTDIGKAFEAAKRFGHRALAVTDHGVVQAFPEAAKAAAKTGVKAIFGLEGYFYRDCILVDMDQDYVVFDLETTGLKPENAEIIEIGAVKLHRGGIVDRFHTFVNDGVVIPANITALTSITQDMITGAASLREALIRFAAFSAGCCLVAHNASFDMGFINSHGERFNLFFDQPYADTLKLSRSLLHDLENHKLDTICRALGLSFLSHHRAVDDAAATAEVFLVLLSRLRELGQTKLPVWRRGVTDQQEKKAKGRHPLNHIIILAKNQNGMKNLYRLVSYSHLDHFRIKPVIPLSLLALFREGLIIGSACEQGELFRAVRENADEEALLSTASFYDYLEIQPRGNNYFLVRNGICDEEDLLAYNRRIVALGKQLNIPVAATGDVHFLEPEDAIFREVLMTKMGFEDAGTQPPLYFRTTNEMLEEFSYLGTETAQEVVIEASNKIAESCSILKPFPDGTHAPQISGADDDLQEMTLTAAEKVYGVPLPEIVQARLDRELASIVNNGFASLYLMAQKLVSKSLSDGYIVGSRGSVGSSFVATMAGITEVNPLQPHYVCPACRYSNFNVDRLLYACGVDMPDLDCPICGHRYNKCGYDIPFEVFLGFKGDKTPDIDLNVSGDYQSTAHRFVEEMVGRNHAFRAGTISGIKDMKAQECVASYAEKTGRVLRMAEQERLILGCLGVKVTTGQHPGGIVIVPKDTDILDFTALQYPADKHDKNTITTHFDFHSMDERLVKLDILGHDDPTALRMLQDLTGVSPLTIPLDDIKTRKIFSSAEPLGIDLSELNCKTGSLGLPEFGTGFVRTVLESTLPSSMEELVRIAGLTHGTDVWLSNAEPLITNRTATLAEVICTRDDIMNYLMARGMEASLSFEIMERVRKGRGLLPSMEQAMLQHEIPLWFIDSCKKIGYLFPRSHAAAYAIMSFRIAYYKVHYPLAFYAAYFSVRADLFDVGSAFGGTEKVLEAIRALQKGSQGQTGAEKKRGRELITILELVYEMNLRGIRLLPVDIYRSDATKFLIEDDALRPPFNAIPGVGTNAAISLADNREGGMFLSVEEFRARTGANSAVIAAMQKSGCFTELPQTTQISLFSLDEAPSSDI